MATKRLTGTSGTIRAIMSAAMFRLPSWKRELAIAFVVFVCLAHSVAGIKENPFRNALIKVTGYNAPPGMGFFEQPDGNLTYFGYNKDILDVLFNYIGMKYQMVNIDEKEVASKGFVGAMLDQLRRKEVDLNLYGFVQTLQRVQEFDFTIPVQSDQYRFLVKYPEEESRLWGPIRPFQSSVWILFLLTIVAVDVSISLLMFFVRKLKPDLRRRPLTFTELMADNAVYIVTIIASQAEYVHERKLPVRIVIAVWILMALTLVNSYTGNLVSYLTVPKLNPIVNSFEDLAYKTQSGLVIDSRSVLADTILSAKTGPYKVIGNRLRADPVYMFKNVSEIGRLVLEENVPFIQINLVVQFSIGLDLKRVGYCRYTQSKPLPLFSSFSFILPKNSPYTELFNSRLQYMLENGMLHKIRENYKPRIGECLITNRNQRPKTTPLKLVDISSALFILGVGYGLAIVAMVVEVMVGLYRNGSKLRRNDAQSLKCFRNIVSHSAKPVAHPKNSETFKISS